MSTFALVNMDPSHPNDAWNRVVISPFSSWRCLGWIEGVSRGLVIRATSGFTSSLLWYSASVSIAICSSKEIACRTDIIRLTNGLLEDSGLSGGERPRFLRGRREPAAQAAVSDSMRGGVAPREARGVIALNPAHFFALLWQLEMGVR